VTPPGRVYLLGSSHGAAVAEVLRRLVADSGTPRRVAVSFAALASADGAAQARGLGRSLFPGAVVERFAVEGERDAMPADDARAVVDRADVLFFGGGDPVLAARRLVAAGADAWVREARARGAACVGLSAGSIALGAFWGDWPADDPDGEPELVPCIAAVKQLVVDCHAEEDDWEELRLVQQKLGHSGEALTFAGIGHGAALIVGPGDELTWIGKAKVLDRRG
jgi:cyanophycinase-like exopeptidase